MKKALLFLVFVLVFWSGCTQNPTAVQEIAHKDFLGDWLVPDFPLELRVGEINVGYKNPSETGYKDCPLQLWTVDTLYFWPGNRAAALINKGGGKYSFFPPDYGESKEYEAFKKPPKP